MTMPAIAPPDRPEELGEDVAEGRLVGVREDDVCEVAAAPDTDDDVREVGVAADTEAEVLVARSLSVATVNVVALGDAELREE